MGWSISIAKDRRCLAKIKLRITLNQVKLTLDINWDMNRPGLVMDKKPLCARKKLRGDGHAERCSWISKRRRRNRWSEEYGEKMAVEKVSETVEKVREKSALL